MPTIDLYNVVLNEEAKNLETAYNSDPKVKAAIDKL